MEKFRVPNTQNMKTQLDPLFSQYLLRIGDRIEKNCYNDYFKLPSTIIISYVKNINIISILIDIVFPNINKYPNNLDLMDFHPIN